FRTESAGRDAVRRVTRHVRLTRRSGIRAPWPLGGVCDHSRRFEFEEPASPETPQCPRSYQPPPSDPRESLSQRRNLPWASTSPAPDERRRVRRLLSPSREGSCFFQGSIL